MVSALDRAVRDNLATQGLRDPNVTILDPATGTGTFLLGIAERVGAQSEAEAGEGMAALALQESRSPHVRFRVVGRPLRRRTLQTASRVASPSPRARGTASR